MKRIVRILALFTMIMSLSSCEVLFGLMEIAGSSSSSKDKGNSTTSVNTDENRKGKKNYEDTTFQQLYKNKYKFSGAGTPDDPVQITELWQLYYIRATNHSQTDYDQICTSKMGGANGEMICYKLMNDLDFSKDGVRWCSPFNYAYDEFSGVFDGNGHTIKNFDGCSPLFDIISTKGIVKNLTIEGNIKFNPEDFEMVGPFCKKLHGTLINCVFNGQLSNAKYIYDAAYDDNNTGTVIGCVINNTGVTNGFTKGVNNVASTKAKDTAKSVESLNNELGVWNALYTKRPLYQAQKKFTTSGSSFALTSGKATGTPAKAEKITGDSGEIFFSNIVNSHTQLSDSYWWYEPFDFPDPKYSHTKTSVYAWSDDSKVSLTPLGTSEKINSDGGKTIYFYALKFYNRNLDGSYTVSNIEDKKCYVDAIINDTSTGAKGLFIKYYGGSSNAIICNDVFMKASYTCDDNIYYDRKVASRYVNTKPSQSEIKSMINTLSD